ncbi:iron-containing alcohol dehydrogenase [Methanolobus psychrotolerans]|uniref:iron-containing alcohol dehydrogenase n=1 Tax=Methanolobus psychrotolerans TaxID=1874706 RepID=UPI000B916CC0|nr:iron-containing alcohol dehydrogenase [Methanolobus psychrotolerans]
MLNKFSCHTDIMFGQNASLSLSSKVKEMDLRHIGMIVDEGVALNTHVQKIITSFESDGSFQTNIFRSRAGSEPDYDYLDEVTAFFHDSVIDCIIGIGGGSACDLAKGVGIMLRNPGKGIDYRGFDKVNIPGVPVILIPTTAGTGTEATRTAVFTDKKEVRKLGINGKNVGSLLAVLDPMVLLDAPRIIKSGSALDALVHAIEAFACKNSNTLSKAIGKEAFGLLFNNLVKAIDDKGDIIAHENLFMGSHLAGIAMYNVGGGPASGISYPLGSHFKVPHGIAGGIFLPHVIRFNVEHGFLDYAELYDLIDGHKEGLTPEEKSLRFADKFQEFYCDTSAPLNLTGYGVSTKDIELLVSLTMQQRLENLKLNPVNFGENDVRYLLSKVIVA